MSWFSDFTAVLDCASIAVGTVASAITLTRWRSAHSRGRRGAENKALQDLRVYLLIIAMGMSNLAIQAKNHTAPWVATAVLAVAAAALIAISIWNVRSLLKSRRRRKPDHPTAAPS